MAFEGLEKGKEYEIKYKSGLLDDNEENILRRTNDKLQKNIITESGIEDVDILNETGKQLQTIMDKYSIKNRISDTYKLNNDEIKKYINTISENDLKPVITKGEYGKIKLTILYNNMETTIKLKGNTLGNIRQSLIESKGISNIIKKNKSGYVNIDGKFYGRPNIPDFNPTVEIQESIHKTKQIESSEKDKNQLLMNLSDLFENGSSKISPELKKTLNSPEFRKSLNIALNNNQKIIVRGQVNNTPNAQKDNEKKGNLSLNRAEAVKQTIMNSIKNGIVKDKLTKLIIIEDGGIGDKNISERRVDVFLENKTE